MTRDELAPVLAAIGVAAGARIGEALGASAGHGAVAVAVPALLARLATADGHEPRRRVSIVRVALAVLAVGALGAASMQRALDGVVHSPFDAARSARAAIVVRGTLVGDPLVSRWDTEVLVRMSWFARDDRSLVPRPAHRTLLVRATSTDGVRLGALEGGDEVVLAGELAPLPPRQADTRWEHAVALLGDVEVREWRPVTQPLLRVADALRARVLAGMRVLGASDRALLGAFVLGDTRDVDRETRDDFRAAGLAHLLAVSGANVAFALAVVGPARRRLPVGGRVALGLTVVVVFAAMTRFEPSVLRASVMAAIVMGASVFGRPVRALRALSYAVVLLVLVDPFLVHSLGFWLSVGATTGIALLGTALARRVPGPRVVRETTAVAIAAECGVLPVLVLGGVGVPWIAPAANLLAVPAAEPISVLALPAAFIGAWWTAGCVLPLHVTAALLAWVRAVARAAHRDPGVVALAAAFVVAGGVAWERRRWAARAQAPSDG